MSIELPLGAKVQFTLERLSILTPRDRQGLVGRIGVVQTDSRFVSKPTVYFPDTGDKPELRLFRVDPRHLELVENPPKTAMTPSFNNAAIQSGPSEAEPTSPAESGGNLSQNDADNLFD